jgi:hypothetical protein
MRLLRRDTEIVLMGRRGGRPSDGPFYPLCCDEIPRTVFTTNYDDWRFAYIHPSDDEEYGLALRFGPYPRDIAWCDKLPPPLLMDTIQDALERLSSIVLDIEAEGGLPHVEAHHRFVQDSGVWR